MKPQNEEEIPEDLGIKIGSEAEAFWTNAKEKLEKESKQAEYEILINQHVIKLCEEKIAEEQEKRKDLNIPRDTKLYG